ncbi:recombinase family protein [Candidatus Bathyarchaeota archaeon]|nr:recombinase family protein [Candidatus Bathyarchaeota archaeon]
MSETNDEKVVFAAIYARTSSPNQKSNYSIEGQVNQCWSYCQQRGWIVRYVFIDECQSGRTIERPKFQLMLEKAKNNEIDVIVFWKLDRFCRSLVDLVNIERMLRSYGVGLCSVTEFIDTTTPVGRFNFRNLASVAELERELIGERARLGLHALAREHKWPNPHPPLGYDKNEDGTLVTNSSEAKLVRKIFSMYIREKSMAQVAFLLNREGIRTKKGGKWTARAVRDIITNNLYIGDFCVAGVKEHVEKYRILSDETFQKAQEIRRRFEKKGAKRPLVSLDRKTAKIEEVMRRYYLALRKFGILNFLEEENQNCSTIKIFPLEI